MAPANASCDRESSGPGSVDGEVRQHERQDDERRERGERRARALDIEREHAMAQAAEQQAKPDDAVADDHDGREYGVAGEGARFFAAGEHERDDQRSLDDGDGEREDERAERLADAERNDFRVVHGGKDGRDQGGGHEADEGPAEFASPHASPAGRPREPARRGSRQVCRAQLERISSP